MTDYTDLLARLRFCATNPGYDEIALSELSAAADALEAQGRRLAALEAAAGKVTCYECEGVAKVLRDGKWQPCPDCADLRALLTPPPAPGSTPAAD